ncbi:MAG: hypothetical protein WA981_11325 [Glaciecola sp.]
MTYSKQQTLNINLAANATLSGDALSQINGGLFSRAEATSNQYELLNPPRVKPDIGEIITMADHEHGGKFALML